MLVYASRTKIMLVIMDYFQTHIWLFASSRIVDETIDPKVKAGNTNLGGRLSTVDLLIKLVGRFIKKLNNIFNINWADLK
jgi:hypothetical protein